MLTKNNTKYRRPDLNESLRPVEYLLNNMGFELMKNPFDPKSDILVKSKSGNFLKLVSKQGVHCDTKTLVYTDDCLHDYFNLKSAGIRFTKEPHYTAEGLAAEFADSYGNYYIVLEKRIYEED